MGLSSFIQMGKEDDHEATVYVHVHVHTLECVRQLANVSEGRLLVGVCHPTLLARINF